MKKIIPLLIWLALIVNACAAPASVSTPVPITATAPQRQATSTPSATLTPTETPTPTPVPKAPEQLAAEDAIAAFAAGARLGDYEGWAEVQPATKYYAFYKHSADPKRVMDEDLAQLDAFVHEMRRLTFEEAIGTNFDAARSALVVAAKNGMYSSMQSPEEVAAMDQAQLLEYYRGLGSEVRGRRLTITVLDIMFGRDHFFTPNEIIGWETDRNGQVLFASNVAYTMAITGSGYYGFFERDSYDYFTKGPDYAPFINMKYTIPMFGRNIERKGVHYSNDPLMADYVGRFPLPNTSQNGLWGISLWMKTPDGKIYEHAMAVATKPFNVPAGSVVFGMFGSNQDNKKYDGVLLENIQVESKIAIDKDSYSEYKTLLTADKLQEWASWIPHYVKIYTGYFMNGDKRATTVFDPDTGLIIISSRRADDYGYMFFDTNGYNPWP